MPLTAICNSQPEILEWIVSEFNLKWGDLGVGRWFSIDGKGNGLDIKWISGGEHPEPESCYLLGNSRLRLIDFLIRKFSVNPEKLGLNIDGFNWLCGKGYLETIRWFRRYFIFEKSDVAENDYTCLKLACKKGQLEAIRMLINKFRIKRNFFINNDIYYLKLLLKNGYFESVKWLIKYYEIEPSEVKKPMKRPFKKAYKKYFLSTKTEWLKEWIEGNIHLCERCGYNC